MARRLWMFLAVAVGGCSGPLVSHDYDPGLDFSRLKTWAWAPQLPQADGSSGPASVTSLTHERIRSAVEQRLGAMGYMRVDEQSADFWVQHYAAIGQRMYVDPGYGWSGDDLRGHDQGSLIVDVITPKDKRLVWRGTARSAVDPELTPKERDAHIREAVKKILDEFPPKK